jgi:hypothetical protein
MSGLWSKIELAVRIGTVQVHMNPLDCDTMWPWTIYHNRLFIMVILYIFAIDKLSF